MIVHVPTSLLSYTQAVRVEAHGTDLAGVLEDLDRRFPGLRFRIVDERDALRRHIKLFVNQEMTEDLTQSVEERDDVHIICALSGG